jgi:predicted kinase
LAWQNQIPHIVISCEAPHGVLLERIIQRQAAGQDPSEASLNVSGQQLQSSEPLNEEELIDSFALISTGKALNQMQLQALKQQINTVTSD